MRSAPSRSIRFGGLAFAVVGGALALCALLPLTGCGPSQRSKSADSPSSGSAKKTPAEIAAKAMPAIVSIRTPHTLGTGFIVDKNGLIATNLHVLAGGGPKVVVTLADGREFLVVELTNGSPERDLAIARIDAKGLPTLTLGDSDAMHPGDPVVAIGHPMGLEGTVSNGLVSAVRPVSDTLTILQISAPIAPGSSGGPIFNERGEVIGVATAILREGQNLGFGVPANYVKALLKDTDPISIEAFAAATTKPEQKLPAVKRDIPKHAVAVLGGCSDDTIRLIVKSLSEAVQIGAPLYDGGNFGACYHIYEGAALDLERKLPKACGGPVKALGDGRKRAATLPKSYEQAWALRDTFDGLMDVIARKYKGE